MGEVKVAAFMPVLNEGERIARAISSLENQTHSISKLIVVDGGSTDSTHEEVRRKEEETEFDIDLEVIEGAGVRYSSQIGAEKAIKRLKEDLGEDDGVVLRLEGDSALEDHFVEQAASKLNDQENTVFGAQVKPHDPSTDRIKKSVFSYLQNAEMLPKGRGMAFRAQDFLDVNGYKMSEDEDIRSSPVDCLEDGILVTKLRKRGNIVFSHETHVNSTVPSTTATSLNRWRLALKIERNMGPTRCYTKMVSPFNKISYAGKRLAGLV